MVRERLLAILKREGTLTIRELQRELGIGSTTTRYHLHRLLSEGLVETSAEPLAAGAGRPASKYCLTPLADGVFPKRYVDLLDSVLAASRDLGVIGSVFERIAEDLASALQPRVAGRSGEDALMPLLDGLNYGEMLATLRPCDGGWQLSAYNCLYHASGLRFVEVCDLLPDVIGRTRAFCAERIACQRNNNRSCDFFISVPPADD